MARRDSGRDTAEAAAGSTENLAMIIYDNGTHKFICEALPGTALTDAEWRIMRMANDSTKQIAWCNGTTNFSNLATNDIIVFALAYS